MYRIEKSKYPDTEGTHVIFRYYQTKYGFNAGRVFKGTYKQCKEKMEELKNGNNKAEI